MDPAARRIERRRPRAPAPRDRAAGAGAGDAGLRGPARGPLRLLQGRDPGALARLRVEGLVLAEPRRGHVIAPLTLRDVREIYELRLRLEPPAAAAAAGQIPRTELERLRALLRAGARPRRPGSVDRFMAANRAVHVTVAAAAGNGRAAAIVARLLDDSERARLVALRGGAAGRGLRARAEHQRCSTRSRPATAPQAERLMADADPRVQRRGARRAAGRGAGRTAPRGLSQAKPGPWPARRRRSSRRHPRRGGPPATRWGGCGRASAGSHQARSPSSVTTAGAMTMRTISTSIRIARPRPRPNIFAITSGWVTKASEDRRP